MLFPFKVNSNTVWSCVELNCINTIELTVHTSCYCVLDLLGVKEILYQIGILNLNTKREQN